MMVNRKPPFSKRFRSTLNKTSSGLRSVYEKLRFRSGLVWTVGPPTVEIKLRFKSLLRGTCIVWTASGGLESCHV